MSEMDAIVKEFIQESTENLDELDRDLVELEKDPTSKELLAGIFRTVHSIKGATGFLGFAKLGAVAHVGENLLSRLRGGALVLNPEMTTGLLSLVDALRKMLSEIAEKGQEGDGNYAALVDTLTQLQEGVHVGKDPPAPPTPVHAAPPRSTEKMEAGGAAPSPAESRPAQSTAERPGEPGRDHANRLAPPDRKSDSAAQANASSREQHETGSRAHAGGSLRVDVLQLDNLMNLVGELVLTRNQILQICSRQEDAAFLATSQRLNQITSELQQGVAKVRMQPIDNIWAKFPRLVRDLAVQCGKQVRLEMHGKETELDKAIVEAIQDPLTHLVRNSVDHGIETGEARLAKGKPVEGCITLRAFHENGQVNIEISDDGAGIDLDQVRQKAIDGSLIAPEKARLLDDQDARNLIFLPGFSMAKAVTNISGRGVGMDVVKKNIEKIGGTVNLQSELGRGTTTKIRIPLTLAIVPALLVTTGGDRYAIPQVSLVELVRLDAMEEKGRIENIQGVSFYRLREQLLQLTYLDDQLNVQALSSDAESKERSGGPGVIVVLQFHDQQFGLAVDQVNDMEEIVVRPVGKQLKGIPIYAGATILGDGGVALILDVPGLARRVGIAVDAAHREQAGFGDESTGFVPESSGLLLLEGLDDERIGLPLSQITRLVEFPRSRVERAGSQELMQYGSEILPLFRVSDTLAGGHSYGGDASREKKKDGKIQVVVCHRAGRAMGLVVERILDIVVYDIKKLDSSSNEGLFAPTVIGGQITRILDLEEIFHSIESGAPQSPVAVEVGV